MEAFFEFEKPIATLEKKLQDLRELSRQEGVDLSQEIVSLEKKVATLIDETYAKLTSWQRVQLSRHPNRPYTRDYVDALFPDFLELHGDRCFGDDQSILCGIATWPPQEPGSTAEHKRSPGSFPVLIMGHQKGRSTKERMERNFGMARPEGYRKGMRLMEMAERLKMPILTFIDTPGAYPGLEAEERGQSQAIAESIRLMFKLTVPVICTVIGEGGSGGALAIGIGNRVLMQEYSTYSVISPESCASILWSDSHLAENASEKLKMSPSDLLRLGVIDGIIHEPKGGAHRNWQQTFSLVREALLENMDEILHGKAAKKSTAKSTTVKGKKKTASKALESEATKTEAPNLQQARMKKFRAIGQAALARAKEMAD